MTWAVWAVVVFANADGAQIQRERLMDPEPTFETRAACDRFVSAVDSPLTRYNWQGTWAGNYRWRYTQYECRAVPT